MTVRAPRGRTGGASDCAASGATTRTAALAAKRTSDRTDIGRPPSRQVTGTALSSATSGAEERRTLRVHVQIEHLGDVGLLQQDLLARDERRNRRGFGLVQMEQLLVARTIDMRVRQET